MRSIAGIVFSVATMFIFFHTSQTLNAGTARQLLPSANEFHLTLAEERHSKLSLGPSCTGEAAETLTCRAFALTLANLSKKAVRISWRGCNEPEIRIDRKEPNSSSGWFPVSWTKHETCRPMTWVSLRLKPGQKKTYATRLISPRREAETFAPGAYTLRAQWVLFGCTEEPEGSDCLSPLQVVRAPSVAVAPPLDFQEPVFVISNEVTADAPVPPDFGQMKLAFEVSARRGPPPANFLQKAADCTGEANASIDCIVFHYVIHNLGDRPIRHGGYSCSGYGIIPEYRPLHGEWQPVPSNFWVCTANIFLATPILPGGTAEGDFVLSTLAPGYNTSALCAAGDYSFRFTFQPYACFASPDGTFCLTSHERQEAVRSPEFSRRLSAAASVH